MKEIKKTYFMQPKIKFKNPIIQYLTLKQQHKSLVTLNLNNTLQKQLRIINPLTYHFCPKIREAPRNNYFFLMNNKINPIQVY